MGAKCAGTQCEAICVGSEPPSQVIIQDSLTSQGDISSSRDASIKTVTNDNPAEGRIEAADRGPIKIAEWKAKLEKPPGKTQFGLAHMPAKDGASVLVVAKFLEDGPVDKWNMSCKTAGKAEHMIQVGDRIVEVNGSEGSVRALQAALVADEVTLRMQRYPETFELTLHKASKDQLCGIRMEIRSAPQQTDRVLVVAEVQKNGMVDRWNKEAAWRGEYHMVVTAHMEISSACGISGEPEVMKQALKDHMQLPIVFRRPWSS